MPSSVCLHPKREKKQWIDVFPGRATARIAGHEQLRQREPPQIRDGAGALADATLAGSTSIREASVPSSCISVIDTGLERGARNAALDRACLEWRAAGCGRDVLRWHASTPTASLGRHQALDRELRVDYCRSRGIEIVRRTTSGGALYLDPQQLGFSLVLCPAPARGRLTLGEWLERTSRAVAGGLARFGIAAVHRFPNDVEVDGRKIASVFAARQGDAILVHGIVLLDTDVETMLKVLRVPTEKLSADGLAAARDRLVGVASCARSAWTAAALKTALTASIAASLDRSAEEAATMPEEVERRAEAMQDDAAAIAWGDSAGKIEALARVPEGTLRARADFDGSEMRLSGVELAADAHLEPADFLPELVRAVEQVNTKLLAATVQACAARHALDAPGVGAADFVALLEQLVEKRRFARACGLDAEKANALMPYAGVSAHSTRALLEKASVMLVPYCAKPAWCKWRHRDGCTECGLCEVGGAYRAARERDMQVTTITNYEHLVATLTAMKARGVEAYVGMCCSHFFIKRHRAFAEAGMPALLMDISGSNCYELRQEHLAYAGAFRAEAHLDGELVQHVMRFVPRRPA